MSSGHYQEDPQWKEKLDRLSKIREQADYTAEDVEFIKQNLLSLDDRVRGGAALAAEGCLFDPHVLDLLIQIVEEDRNNAIRKAAIQSLRGVIHEGVMQNLEDEIGSDTEMDYVEEWQEFQEESLKENYLRVKHALLNILENEGEEGGLREASLTSLSDLGFLPALREWISDFLLSAQKSMQVVALQAMGKYPHYWEEELARFIDPEQDKVLLMEAISSSYSSDSERLARQIEKILRHPDPDVLVYALMTLANINRTENLGEILQRFSLHQHPRVQEAARDAIELFSRRNFDQYLEDNLGFDG